MEAKITEGTIEVFGEILINQIKMQNDIEMLRERSDQSASDVHGMRKDMLGIRGDMSRLDERVSGLEIRITKLERSMERMQNDIDHLKDRVGAIEGKLDHVISLLSPV